MFVAHGDDTAVRFPGCGALHVAGVATEDAAYSRDNGGGSGCACRDRGVGCVSGAALLFGCLSFGRCPGSCTPAAFSACSDAENGKRTTARESSKRTTAGDSLRDSRAVHRRGVPRFCGVDRAVRDFRTISFCRGDALRRAADDGCYLGDFAFRLHSCDDGIPGALVV